ncbi:WecB/TagA/CpsF family glycosyltransferase [Mesobacillus foraminis]|uniref:WecB/TagA/CpsF family glycosyltransferase n=1 Tax=Mesobacillus foraminis TaxID=279826 RepID=UPI000EF4B44B|nr:WecB/TagA/CpsF family glycosyltransferase [Mesobacillus foraminis]
MLKNYVTILGIPFINKTFEEMADIIVDRIERKKKTFLVTANPEIVMHTLQSEDYKQAVLRADFVVPDGVGILVGSQIMQEPISERVTGFDLTVRLLELSNRNGWSLYLLGGREEVNKTAAENIMAKYPNAVLAGRHHGFFDEKNTKIQEEIAELKPDIVLVALGFPRQERWIADHIDTFAHGIFIGVGGSIDVLAGTAKRAPEIWQKLNIEWLYRLVKQPSRWRRMLALPAFVFEVAKYKRSLK